MADDDGDEMCRVVTQGGHDHTSESSHFMMLKRLLINRGAYVTCVTQRHLTCIASGAPRKDVQAAMDVRSLQEFAFTNGYLKHEADMHEHLAELAGSDKTQGGGSGSSTQHSDLATITEEDGEGGLAADRVDGGLSMGGVDLASCQAAAQDSKVGTYGLVTYGPQYAL